jgi:hypothetical protein
MTITHEHALPESHCPWCGYTIDAVTCLDERGNEHDKMPQPGDLTVCVKCAHICAFADDLTLRTPTDTELEGMPTALMRLLSKVQAAVRLARAKEAPQ